MENRNHVSLISLLRRMPAAARLGRKVRSDQIPYSTDCKDVEDLPHATMFCEVTWCEIRHCFRLTATNYIQVAVLIVQIRNHLYDSYSGSSYV